MCKELENNRKFLAWLVYSKKKAFTASDIIREYKAKKGNLIIDGRESIRDFLRGLVEMGTLKDIGGRYSVSLRTLRPLFQRH